MKISNPIYKRQSPIPPTYCSPQIYYSFLGALVVSLFFSACGPAKKQGTQPSEISMGEIVLDSGEKITIDGRILSNLLSNTNENMKSVATPEVSSLNLSFSSNPGDFSNLYRKYLVRVKTLACDISARSGANTRSINFYPTTTITLEGKEYTPNPAWQAPCSSAGSRKIPNIQICANLVLLAKDSREYFNTFEAQLENLPLNQPEVQNNFYDLYSSQKNIAQTLENFITQFRCPQK